MALQPEFSITGALMPEGGMGVGVSLLPAHGPVAAFMAPYLTPEAGSDAILGAVHEAMALQFYDYDAIVAAVLS